MDLALGRGETGIFNVGRISHEQKRFALIEDAIGFFFGRGWLTVHRVEIKLVVAGIYDSAVGSLNDHAHRIRDGVRDAEEVDAEIANLHSFFFFHYDNVEGRKMRKFFLPFLNH